MSFVDVPRVTDVVVVGAGLSGLVAAGRLQQQGLDVLVLDKGRGPGGRLATRRIRTSAGTAVLDHGAQFFTVRSDAFGELMRGWPVHVWHHGPQTARSITDDPATRQPGGHGHPRYVGDAGMNGIAKHLARDLDVRVGHQVTRIHRDGDGWRVDVQQSEGPEQSVSALDQFRAHSFRAHSFRAHSFRAHSVLVTAPLPQAAALVPTVDIAGVVDLPGYQPCLGLLAVVEDPGDLVAVQFSDGPVNYLANNASKGLGDISSITVHATGEESARRFEDDDATVTEWLQELATPWLQGGGFQGGGLQGGGLLTSQVKRWRYAQPVQTHDDPAVTVARGLVLAGDLYGQAKVEGAALSGLAAADLLLT